MKKFYPTDNKTKSGRPRIVPNQLIADRYMTQYEIRNDGMTSVYMAFDMQKERNVALMLMPEELSRNMDMLEDLKLQVDSISDLDHENITQFYSLYFLKDKVFAVMEFVQGRTLAEYLSEKGGKLSVNESLPLLKQIGSALAYAHAQTSSICHLGLKPQNILLTEKKQIKIMEFGIARILSSLAANIPGKENSATIAYLAPEQFVVQVRNGGEQEIGPWTDVYALAAVAYEMLSGEPPFHSDDLRSQIMNQKPKKIDGIPDSVNQAILKGLSKDSSKRPESPGKFITLLSGEKPQRKPKPEQPAKTITPKKAKKPKLIFSAVGILLVLALGAAGWFVFQKKPEEIGYKIAMPADKVEKQAPQKAPLPQKPPPATGKIPDSKPTESTETKNVLTGEISVVSIPREVEVYLDGIPKGTTPITLKNIEPGVHVLTLEKEGFEFWTRDLEISSESTSEIVATLTPLYGSFAITSIPPSAEVYLDGVKQGVTPLQIGQVQKGIRKVEIVKAGYNTWSKNVQVIPGGLQDLHADLKVAMGSVNITSDPDNADIYISEIKHGTTPMTVKLEKGPRRIKLKKPGYMDWEEDVEVAEGDIRAIRAIFKPITGSLTITSTPDDAYVYVSGSMMGKTPLVLKEVQLGKHEIRITKEKYLDWTTSLKMASPERKQITASLKPAPPKSGDVWIEPVTGMKFVWVREGCYPMGSRPDEPGRKPDESPLNEVCVDGMWIGKYEVTQGQWKKVLGADPSFFSNKPDHPVENVSWSNIQIFIEKLNEMNRGKHTFRLPTEAEWEHACRIGGANDRFCGGDQIDSIAWHKENCARTTHPVGQKETNRAGLYDMSGNVSEWVMDTYSADAYQNRGKKNPVNQAAGPDRVIRGGSWTQEKDDCRSAARNFFSEKRGRYDIGFRLVKNHSFSGPSNSLKASQ